MFITGPDVIRTVTHEEVSKETLGGADTHSQKSGVCHLTRDDDASCLAEVRRLLGYLPSNNLEKAPRLACDDPEDRLLDDLEALIPTESNQPYDMLRVIEQVIDRGSFLQTHEAFARNVVTGFGRLGGAAVGIVANQPAVLAGVLDSDASVKAARFVRCCDAFNVPLLCLVDVPGFLPGVDQEHRGIILHGAKLLYAFSEATVPKLTVIKRNAYGGAYDVMSSKHIGADVNLAFPGAEIAVMGPGGAVSVMHRRELAEAEDPDALREQLIEDYRARFANPYRAAALGFVDEVIRPRDLRKRLCECLHLLRDKRDDGPRRKHGNIPL
jgi:propionyl-CoA carboxylase beta chain